jgi:uncharacterized membrane protein YkvA (DUF1232 family)
MGNVARGLLMVSWREVVMSNSMLCGKCGELYGTNRACGACMGHLVLEGAAGVDEEEAREAAERFRAWEKKGGGSSPGDLRRHAALFYKMLRDALSGRYPNAPWASVAALAFALLYLVNPFDLVPDVIPVLGWLDDAAVLAAVGAAAQSDLEDYKRWAAKRR